MRKAQTLTTILGVGLVLTLLLGGCGGEAESTIAANTPLPPASLPATLPPATPTLQPTDPIAPTPTALPPTPTQSPAAAGQEIRQWATTAEASSEYGDTDWAAHQATGAPDTPVCGDHETAWASASADGVEWLQVGYVTPVIPTQVRIVQSHNPSHVIQVELVDLSGAYHTIYSGRSQAPGSCPYTLSIPVQEASYQAVAVKITIDQTALVDWNEIDAVELIGRVASGGAAPPPTPTSPQAAGEQLIRQWAASAEASSQYADADWAAFQASGAPNTPECGDHGTAWASATSSGSDWLRLHYATAVRPVEVHIVQTYNPGQIVRVELLDAAGRSHPVYAAAPQTLETCPYTLSIRVEDADYRAVDVLITLDQSSGQGWNEIDAVEMVGWGQP